jgi:hypothetical protein
MIVGKKMVFLIIILPKLKKVVWQEISPALKLTYEKHRTKTESIYCKKNLSGWNYFYPYLLFCWNCLVSSSGKISVPPGVVTKRF